MNIKKRFKVKPLHFQILKYAIFGIFSTLIHLSIAFASIYFLEASVVVSNLLGFLSAFTFSYLGQSKYVFNSSLSFKHASKYFLVQFFSLIVSLLFTLFLVDINSYIKTLIVIFLLPIITFILHKVWTFRQ
jgi:putative flippase GtrA